MKSKAISLLLVLLILPLAAAAQAKKPLTNDDVVKMVVMGFDESTVIKTIRANEANFNTSVEALLELRNGGVSKPILDAMLDAQAATNAKPDPFGGLPQPAGVYYKGSGGWTQLQDAPAPKTVSKGLLGAVASLGKPKTRYAYRGAHAPVQIKETQPVFYVRGVGKFGRDAEIVRLEVKEETREVEFASDSAIWGSDNGKENGTVLSVNVARIADDALIITPNAPLKAGEYLLSLDTDHRYDFGIAPGQ